MAIVPAAPSRNIISNLESVVVRYDLVSSCLFNYCLNVIMVDSSVLCTRRGSAENHGRSSIKPLLFIIVESGV